MNRWVLGGGIAVAETPKVKQDAYCIAGREAIYGDFSGFHDLCKQLGGSFR